MGLFVDVAHDDVLVDDRSRGLLPECYGLITTGAEVEGRGFCPSCGGRRMADTAAWLVDRVLREVLVRQWVLTLPFALRRRHLRAALR